MDKSDRINDMKVKELDPHLINKIAAGEVIERPASVVKELVENSIDAGCTMLEVSIENGGIEHITVADDGEGMTKEDLLLAIKRHTTSKISTEADLENIRSLGFRGEALASIVEVSKVTIITKNEAEPEATRVEIEGGQVKKIQAAGHGRGTTVEAKELFFNTPARRKFLKKEKTEAYHIVKVLKRFILSHPQIHFRFFQNGKKLIEVPKSSDLQEVIANLYDAELARSLIEIRLEGNRLRVKGLISKPHESRADRSEQFIFVNGRYVKDSAINYAISKAYEGLVEKDKHPVIFLFIEIDPQMVDVNVHPKKEEVRFANQILVQAAVKKAIGDALVSQQIMPRMEPIKTREEIKYKEHRRLDLHYDETKELDLKSEILEAQKEREAAKREEKSYRIIGQVHDTYIIVQTEGGLEIIDQHVAHERILFERFIAQLLAGQILKQRLLIPITIELSPDKAVLLAEHLNLLAEKLGIGMEHFGGGSFILRDWPQALTEGLSKEKFKNAIDRILETLEHEDELDFEELAKELATKMACEAALAKGRPLKLEEMEDLIVQLKKTQNPYSCPHGRPIIVSYSLEELEKGFGRR